MIGIGRNVLGDPRRVHLLLLFIPLLAATAPRPVVSRLYVVLLPLLPLLLLLLLFFGLGHLVIVIPYRAFSTVSTNSEKIPNIFEGSGFKLIFLEKITQYMCLNPLPPNILGNFSEFVLAVLEKLGGGGEWLCLKWSKLIKKTALVT